MRRHIDTRGSLHVEFRSTVSTLAHVREAEAFRQRKRSSTVHLLDVRLRR